MQKYEDKLTFKSLAIIYVVVGAPNTVDFEEPIRIPYVCSSQIAYSCPVWVCLYHFILNMLSQYQRPLWVSGLLFLCKFSYCNPRPLLTPSLTTFSNSSLRSRHIFAASTFAGLSSFGSANILITLIRIISVDWIGLHLSLALS